MNWCIHSRKGPQSALQAAGLKRLYLASEVLGGARTAWDDTEHRH